MGAFPEHLDRAVKDRSTSKLDDNDGTFHHRFPSRRDDIKL